MQFVRHTVFTHAATGDWRHDNTVGEIECAHSVRRKKIGSQAVIGHVLPRIKDQSHRPRLADGSSWLGFLHHPGNT
jgi:hypothetical protein